MQTDLEFRREVHRNLGETYYEAQRYGEAAAAFQTVLAILDTRDPYRDYALLSLGHCYLAIGASAASRDSYEGVLSSPTASSAQQRAARDGLLRLERG
ncbi:MAG: tetratricopeptide repeat protein [Candidatus Rokuibacteriota bacterium]